MRQRSGVLGEMLGSPDFTVTRRSFVRELERVTANAIANRPIADPEPELAKANVLIEIDETIKKGWLSKGRAH
ncbi:hypothetical protein [Bradyrhizobium sp. LMG 9283]|uniref:hypothetical protein n=1 Tax=Bradyrhizobium sp. LMG 9283 TaxID=592064 RepID=UPI00388E6FDB